MWYLIILLVVLPFGIAAWIGAPYLPTLRRDGEDALGLVNLKPGQTLIDLGSGDGRLLRRAARQGIHGVGYEINPFVYVVSLLVTWRYRDIVKIYLADFWTTPLPAADAVYVFLIDRLMPKLDTKLSRELQTPTPVVSLAFKIPGRDITRHSSSAWRYDYPAAERLAQPNQ